MWCRPGCSTFPPPPDQPSRERWSPVSGLRLVPVTGHRRVRMHGGGVDPNLTGLTVDRQQHERRVVARCGQAAQPVAVAVAAGAAQDDLAYHAVGRADVGAWLAVVGMAADDQRHAAAVDDAVQQFLVVGINQQRLVGTGGGLQGVGDGFGINLRIDQAGRLAEVHDVGTVGSDRGQAGDLVLGAVGDGDVHPPGVGRDGRRVMPAQCRVDRDVTGVVSQNLDGVALEVGR